MTFTVRLPVPPSANELFVTFPDRGGMRRGKTKIYKAWLTAAGWCLNAARCQPIKGPVMLELLCPENGRRDLSNHLKATEDLLVGMSLIEDDRCKIVRRIILDWHSLDSDLHLTVRAM